MQRLIQAGLAGLDPPARELLDRLAAWLREEAVAGGGIGPNEVSRLWSRHICDSLAFALVSEPVPRRAVDIGSGVGLPGLPLAILWPDTQWTLVDRSERRTRLARRAVRVLALDNVTVEQKPHTALTQTWPLVVSRATFPPDTVVAELARLIEPGGRALVALRRGRARPSTPPTDTNLKVELHPIEVLDPPAWFLMIQPCD